MYMESTRFIVVGCIIHYESKEKLKIMERGWVTFCNGRIMDVGENYDSNQGLNMHVIHLEPGQFLLPGFIDTHIHAPQYVNAGLGLDKPLLQWLDSYTYPLEKQFNSCSYAQDVYKSVVKRTLENGTTTAAYYATIHAESSERLADVVIRFHQRGLIGKVCMDQECPEGYGETTDESLVDTLKFVNGVINKRAAMAKPIITPRFAVNCSMELMKGLAAIARTFNLPIQTHIAESRGEVDMIRELYPQCLNYTDVYDQAGLLKRGTILAHGIYLSDPELSVLSKRGVSIAHCPNSNGSLHSGSCDVRRLMSAGLHVGLGTDVSGGYSPSMLNAMRCALFTSAHLGFSQPPPYAPLNFRDALYMATLGGAHALCLESETGNFKPGKSFDALIITMNAPRSPIDTFGTLTPDEMLQKFFYLGDDRNITQVFVAGYLCKNTRPLATARFPEYPFKSPECNRD